MNAPVQFDIDAAIQREIEGTISYLWDSRARRKIVDAWAGGWIVAEDAMELLVSLDLIEYSGVEHD
jgi:hypothetical protein